MKPDILADAAAMSARGEPFVLATVVWRRSPSSGKAGATALITSEGRVRGWLGGACAEPTVVREARRALEEGSPRLLFLGPPEELAGHERDGVVTVPIACQSEGAMEVHVEPVLPQPQLVAIGRSPAAIALTALAGALGWRSLAVDDGGDPGDHPSADRIAHHAGSLRRRRTVVRRRRDAGPLRRSRTGTGPRDAGLVHRPHRLPEARRLGAGLSPRSRRLGRGARARARASWARPRHDPVGRHRGRDPRGDRPAASRRAAATSGRGDADRHARGDRPRVRDDRGGGRRAIHDACTTAGPTTSARRAARRRSRPTPPRTSP